MSGVWWFLLGLVVGWLIGYFQGFSVGEWYATESENDSQ